MKIIIVRYMQRNPYTYMVHLSGAMGMSMILHKTNKLDDVIWFSDTLSKMTGYPVSYKEESSQLVEIIKDEFIRDGED